MARGDEEKWTKKVVQWKPRTSRRSAGMDHWVDDIKEVTGPLWQRKAQDRAQWKTLGKTFVLCPLGGKRLKKKIRREDG